METGRNPQQMISETNRIAERGFAHARVNQGPRGWDPLSVPAATGPVGDPDFELGTAIVPTYPRHPVNLAASALTVQALTGGRPTLGIGPSHRWIIADQLGIPTPLLPGTPASTWKSCVPCCVVNPLPIAAPSSPP